MKSNILVGIGLLILAAVIATAIAMWQLSASSEFFRKDSSPPTGSSPTY
jgi:hypothetical protein